MTRPSSELPSRRQILNGFYIDFEGFARSEHRASPPPVLIGVYRDGHFRQVVFTRAYRWAAEDPGVEHDVSFCENRDAFLKELVGSVRIKRPLFAFSEHELRVIKGHLGYGITKRYRNVRSIAKRWLNQRVDRYPSPEAFALRDIVRSMGITLECRLPEGGVTSRLRAVREHGSSKRRWAAAPERVRRKWRQVLTHNRSDVLGIRDMMLRMREIEDE
jgi:hypothetical protein